MLHPDSQADIASLLPLAHLTVVARNEEVRMRVQPGEHPGHRRPGERLRIDLPGVRRLDVPDDVGVPLQQHLQPVGGREPARRLDAEDRRRDGRPHQERHQEGDDPRPEPHGVILAACGKTHAAFERRCIPAEPGRCAALVVAFRSENTRYSSLMRLVSRAPARSRRSRGFHHRLPAGVRPDPAYSSSRFLPRIRFPTHAIPIDSV